MTYIGVGTAPFKGSGKGGWGEGGAWVFSRGAAEALAATRLPWALAPGVVATHTAFHQLVSCHPQEDSPRVYLWGYLPCWITCFKRKSSSLDGWDVSFVCLCTLNMLCAMFLTAWQYRSTWSFLSLLEISGWAVQAVKRCGECLLSFWPLCSIGFWDTTSRWMHFRSVWRVGR